MPLKSIEKGNGIVSSDFRRWIIINGKGDYALSLSVETSALFSRIDCSVFDFLTKEKIQCIETKAFPFGEKKYFPEKEGGKIIYRSEYCNLDISAFGDEAELCCGLKRCFIHTECDAKIRLRRRASRSLSDGSQVEVFEAEGSVKVKNRTYEFSFDEDICIFEGRKSSRRKSGISVIGWGVSSEGIFGYSLDSENAKNNIVILENELRAIGKVSFSGNRDNYMKCWFLENEDKSFRLSLNPFFNDHTESRLPFFERAEKLFCSAAGEGSFLKGTYAYLEIRDKKIR